MAKLLILTVMVLSLVGLGEAGKTRRCRRSAKRLARCIADGYTAGITCSAEESAGKSPKNCERIEKRLVRLNCDQCDCRREGVAYENAYEIADPFSVSFEACANACRGTSGCTLIAYLKSGNNACYLQSSVNPDTNKPYPGYAPAIDEDYITMDMKCAPKPSRDCLAEGVEYLTGNVITTLYGKNVDECLQLCSDTATCKSVSYQSLDPLNKLCALRDAPYGGEEDGSRPADNNVMSANVPCLPTM